MTSSPQQDPRIGSIIDWLLSTSVKSQTVPSCRATMAELRRGLRDSPADRVRVIRQVAPHLGPSDASPRERDIEREEWFYLVAALFATHPEHSEKISLAAAFRNISESSDSIEMRFMNLLATRPTPDRMRIPLRQAISLLAAKQQPLNWYRLLTDLLKIERDERKVKQMWARDFYRISKNINDNEQKGETDEN